MMSYAAAPGSGRLRVLRIAHASLTPALRGRERGIAKRYPEIDLRVLAPTKWKETGVDIAAVPDDLFRVVTARTFLSKHIQLFAYDPFPLIRELRTFKPHVIDMDHEPYSLPCAEIVFLKNVFAPSAKIVMQTAQNIYKKYPLPFRYLEKRALKEVSAAYMCSETVREVLDAKGFKGTTVVAPFGIDPELFGPTTADRGKTVPVPVIGFVGRLIAGKGILTLTRALKRLKHKEWKLLVVGDGPQMEAAKSDLYGAGLLERAEFTGAVKYEDTPRLFHKMDILIVPTRTTKTIREQFGRVIIEAMACGVPVIGSTCGAIPEVVGEAGLIFPESDHRALADRITNLIENPAISKQLSARGITRVREKFTWGHAAEVIVSAYISAIQQEDHGRKTLKTSEGADSGGFAPTVLKEEL